MSNTSDDGSIPPLSDLMDAAVLALGGSTREGQRLMARAVDTAMTGERHLLVQAGTGTGKSLAYLVPALRHAVATGRPVVVSTSTIALQTQIIRKDLPRIVEALAPLLPRTPSYALLKGRSNYLCLHKVEGGFPSDLDSGALMSRVAAQGREREFGEDPTGQTERLGEQVRRLHQWAMETDTGDRDSLTSPVSDRAWRQVSVSGAQCLGSSCPLVEECFAERSRAIAREVDVIITNHALLAIDAFDDHNIIPAHDVVIFDEAHDLTDRVTSAVSETLTVGMIRGAIRELRGLGVSGTALEDAAEELQVALDLVPEGRITRDLPDPVCDALLRIRTEARTAFSDAKDAGDDTLTSTAGARRAVRVALQEIMDVAERLLDPDDDDVMSLTRIDGTGRVFLTVSPLSVAGAMRSAIVERRTTILTSATLALGGRFEAAAGAVGLRAKDREDPLHVSRSTDRSRWGGIDVGSPFDYPRQGILYTAGHLPPPGREGTAVQVLAHLGELIEASDGGALCLFSSRRGAEEAAEYLRLRTDLPILVQGEDSISNLVRRFREDMRMSLFGTLGLWQGVDVSGLSCRLVTMDRIPFPRPDEPLAAARQERIAERGGNGFMSVAAHHAALLMAQGAGRLIRTADDRGMVAVLDSRLVTRRYGGFLISAMPPLWHTQDPDVALAALRRLASQATAT